MILTQKVGVAPKQRPDEKPESDRTDPLTFKRLGPYVRRAIMRTRQWLLGQQHADGAWCAELQGDCILESETILLLAYLGREESELARRAAAYLVENQLPAGGWAMFPGGRIEISGSVKAYFALKLTGHEPAAEYMQRAREAILAHGGADAANSFTRFYLALLGQISYDQCPAVPPEAVLLPKWFPINIYAVSSWSRTIIVPLSIVSATQPVRRIDPRFGIRELFLNDPKQWPPLRCPGLEGGTGLLSWDRFFRLVDKALKWCRRHRLLPLRRRALEKAEKWMLERFQGSDGLGAIYPPIVWSLLALKSLGYDDDNPAFEECYRQLTDLVIEDADSATVRLQPCKSPVWDTAITLRALSGSGIRRNCAGMRRAVDWLLANQITRRGDWAKTVDVEPGGWCFEYANDFYPDVDDTAAVLTGLQAQLDDRGLPVSGLAVVEPWRAGADAEGGETPRPLPLPTALPPDLGLLSSASTSLDETAEKAARAAKITAAIALGLKWMLAMQNDDGGWGAFDRNNHREFLCHVPFADHNAMIDPSTPDVTGGVLECLGRLGRRVGEKAVDRAVEFVRRSQQPDGSWFGRWGVNYIYGTWKALTGLIEIGVPPHDPAVVAGANWLLAHQQASGGWGESPDSYEKPHLRGQGTPTASQTAWAVLGLLAAGLQEHPAVTRAVRFLLISQDDDGTWEEPEFTGTGFPRVFYLRYHYYPIYFPLMALAQWSIKVNPLLAANGTPSLRLVGGR